MTNMQYEVAVIGGGPAGMAAALGARAEGASSVVILERDRELGGILQQCVHNGFGLHMFGEQLTGPAYAGRFIAQVIADPGITILLETMALELGDGYVTAINPSQGLFRLDVKSTVLTMGCRERTRGAIRIPGSRPAGVFTAGAAQRMVNMEGYLPGRRVVILGSGDIGLIMARRMTLEGAKVEAVLEIMPYSNGLTRNIVQCLEDFAIPLHLAHTITAIHGDDRVTGVTCAKVDEAMRPIPGTEFDIPCDCILLSVGLIPENELSRAAAVPVDCRTGGPIVDQWRRTERQGYFAAGNAVHVHDLVDWVSEEAKLAGRGAARHAQGKLGELGGSLPVRAGEGVRTIVPQRIGLDALDMPVRLYIRVARPLNGKILRVMAGQTQLTSRPVPFAKPSEMIFVDVPVAGLQELSAEAIEVYVEDIVVKAKGGAK